jgi:hypothetical protein
LVQTSAPEEPIKVFSPSCISTRVLKWLALGFLALAGGQTQKAAHPDAVPHRGDRVLIVVGLPGDPGHAASFSKLVHTYRDWLTERLGFPDSGVRIVFGAAGDPSLSAGAATRENLASEVSAIRKGLAAEDRLWVIILGNANVRAGHVFLHLPGPDIRDNELAKLFDGITCREQVFLVTTAGAGGFLEGLSAKGRIVITATTADSELNETEFPHALGELCRQTPTELDEDADGKVSVWEVFLSLGKLVEARFGADARSPTEHALLDDNGDRIGSERPDPSQTPKVADTLKATKTLAADGELAKKTILPLKIR